MKICPKCGVQHKKRGPFCGYSCANSREQPLELREAKSKKLKAYHATPEGAATRSISSDFATRLNRNRVLERNGEYVLSDPDWMLDIPLTTDDDTYGDDWRFWMKTIRATCDNCESRFIISYDEYSTEDDPVYCPFCGEYITDDMEKSDDELDV